MPLSLEDLPGPACLLAGPDGAIAAHNAAFANWAGRNEVAGIGLADLLPGDPGAARLFQEARSLGVAAHHVERHEDGGACSFWVLTARGRDGGAIVTACDVTALAEAAQAVHAAERDYTNAASHALRAPLAAIKAWASALSGRSHHDEISDGLSAIARQVDRMDDLLGDLRDATRAGAGSISSKRAAHTTAELVLGALGASPHAARVEAGDLPGEAYVDCAHIEAVIGRVLAWIAARQPSGTIPLSAAVEEGEALIYIADRGPALSRRAEGELFGRAARGGKGVALHLARPLAAASGARVFREHTRDGARFVIAMPPAAPVKHEGPARVVVADGDAVRMSRALAALRLDGHDVVGAATAARLFALVDEGACEVAVIDAALPFASDAAALARLRSAAARPAVVLLSASVERPEPLEGAERAGAIAVLPHPVDFPLLGSLVRCVASSRTWSVRDAV